MKRRHGLVNLGEVTLTKRVRPVNAMWHAHLARDFTGEPPVPLLKKKSGGAVSRVAAGSQRGAEEPTAAFLRWLSC